MPGYIPTTMIRFIFTFIVLAGLPGCNKTNKQSDDLIVDNGLRSFLNVHSINTSYEMPAGDTAYLITLLEFEDGKLTRRGLSSLGTVDQPGNRTLKTQLLWGTHEGKFKLTLAEPGQNAESDRDFWRKLDGGWGSCNANTPRDEHDGFVILGFAQSDLDNKGRTNTAIYGNFREALTEKKFIGALAVKTFKTFEDAKKENHP
jgi:hypothetical protein